MRAERRAVQGGDPLGRVLRLTRASMALESFVRAFWPLGTALAFVWAALAFGLAEVTTRPQLMWAMGAAGFVFLLTLVRGLRRFRWPTPGEARARVDATLPGRPLEAMADAPALGRDDPAAQAVWSAHIARMRRLAARARPVAADLRLARHDPWALRLMALVALVAALVFARERGVEAVGTVLAPAPSVAVAAGPSFEGWAEPPAYTGRPTLYLPELAGDTPVEVPEGTIVTLRAYGDPDEFAIAETVSGGTSAALAEAAPGIATAEFPVAASGTVTLDRDGRPVGTWSFAMQPDTPPEIRLSGPVEAAPGGETQVPYAGEDDHGITAAHVRIALDLPRVERIYGLAAAPGERAPLEADLPLPLTGATGSVDEVLVDDFSKQPFAGLPVTVTLSAEDARGQVATSPPEPAVLPMRRFYDPMARALVEQRRDLLWSVGNARRVTQVLRAVSWRPDDAFDSPRAYLVVRAAIQRLVEAEASGNVAAVQDEVAEALWQAAVQIEDGNLGDAKERLARAKERLSQALEEGAPDEEIARLMDELREATRDYMDQMARDAEEKGEGQQAATPPGQTMTQDQIQELMDRIQELSEQGKKAEAQALLEMLQQMLDNMQMMTAEGGEGGQGEGSQGQQSMQGLSDALREQQGLADDSFQQLQRQFQRGRGQQGQQGQGQPGEGQPGQEPGQGDPQGGQPGGQPGQGADERSLAERQEALRRLTEELQRNLPGEAGQGARDALREAQRNMGEASDGLRDGDMAGALDRQSEAIDNLRDGMRQMGEDLRQAEGGDTGDQGEAGEAAAAENGRDPLGRPSGSRGRIGTGSDMLPEADSGARARALLDEIRRRAGEQMRPQLELDYLQRLLDLF